MILHICCNLAGSTVFPQMFEALHEKSLEQIVFVPEKRRKDMGKNEPEGVETHYACTVRRLDTVFFSRKARRSVPAIEKRVDMGRVRLIHAHTLFTDGSIAYRLHRQTGKPYVLTLRYSDIEVIWKYEPHLRPLARRILKNAQRVVFLSNAARDKVLSGWAKGAEREALAAKAVIIPNGIRPEWLDGEARQGLHTPVRVGFAGVLTRRKRPLDVIAAVHRADEGAAGRCVLHACGKGPLEEELKAQLREGDTFAGRVNGMEAMKAFYKECDMLLVPSEAETFGMVYLEAMSQGVPVLYTRGQGFDGQFPEGEAGFAVTCGDIGDQARRIADVCEGYAARSARCVQLAKGYAWPLVAQKWTALYSAALR